MIDKIAVIDKTGRGHAICTRTSLVISVVTGAESGADDPAMCWPSTTKFSNKEITLDRTKLKGTAQVFWANVVLGSSDEL